MSTCYYLNPYFIAEWKKDKIFPICAEICFAEGEKTVTAA
jgi:hypothetical protein